ALFSFPRSGAHRHLHSFPTRRSSDLGNQIWITPFHYGGVGNQQNYVCNAKDTFLYIGGRHCPGLVNTCDMLLLKVDKGTGTLIWDKTLDFGQNGYDEVDGLEILPDGIYCGG